MTVCPRCGAEVEVGDACPRCEAPIPPERTARSLAVAARLTGAAFGLAAAVLMIVDITHNGTLGWSLVGLISGAEAWLLIGFPMLAHDKPRLFLPIMGVSAIAYLWGLERLTAGSWFLSLALPLAVAAFATAALSTALCLKARTRGPNIAAFILLGCTLACGAVENVLSLGRGGHCSFTWSAIVAAVTLPTALLLLGIQARVRSARPRSRVSEGC